MGYVLHSQMLVQQPRCATEFVLRGAISCNVCIEGVHRELIDLRQKLVAHSDRDYVDGRLFRKLLSLEIEQEQTDFLVGATVVTQTVQRTQKQRSDWNISSVQANVSPIN
jgi:hypothetical protein